MDIIAVGLVNGLLDPLPSQGEYKKVSRCDIYSTLRNTVDQLKEHPQADRHKFKKMLPNVTRHRNREEVREDTIAEMKMEDLQGVLREDVDLIFNALVLHDYIEEVDA